MDTILVIDITQARCRVSVVDRDGKIIASSASEYLTGKLGDWAEQEPNDWWQALRIAMQSLSDALQDATPVAITVTGETRILLLAGDNDRLNQALMAEDRRASLEWQWMVEKIGLDILLRSANAVHDVTGHIAKLLWLKKHQPTNYANARTVFIGSHDYITWRLCGARVTDYTTASATDLFALQDDDWATGLLQALEVRTDWLPKLVSSGANVGSLSADVANQLGLPSGIPVLHGTAGIASMLAGAGISKPNQYACYLGDSGWLASTGLQELANPITGLINLRESHQPKLIAVGQMITAAGNFEWLKDRFGPAETAAFPDAGVSLTELLMTLAAEAVPGSGGVVYLPFLAGEQTPYRDPNARGGWFFVSRKTWRSDLYRAVLEGVAYAMRAIQLIMPEPGSDETTALRLFGEESCSPLWAEIFAGVFNCSVDLLPSADDVAARGAAFIAGKSLGWYQGDVPPYEFLRSSGTYVPNPNHVEIYDRRFEVFCKLYPSLHGAFDEVVQGMP